MNVVYQKEGTPTYNGERVYWDCAKMIKWGLTKGVRYDTEAIPQEHTLIFSKNENGANMISGKKKGDNYIPVIDKTGKDINGVPIKEALKDCDHITISIVAVEKENSKELDYRVIIKGEKKTATVKTEQTPSKQPTTITFCAGSGISSSAMVEAGFREVAAVEWNPKEGNEDKFASLYQANHPDAIMFNMPMERLKGNDLPYADVWLATLDCTDYSKVSNGNKYKEIHTMHLFMHLMRLFWEIPKTERPSAVLIENVSEFEKVAGQSLELCFREEGYHITKAHLDSLEYGSRTKRKRFFFLATMYEGFEFPLPEGVKTEPITSDGKLKVDDLEWITPEDSKTLSYFLERQKGKMSHNHVMTVFDITKDVHIGTITKSHHKIQPENWIKHPTKENTFAYLKAEHIRALQGIPEHLVLGDSNKLQVESIGQSVCYTLFSKIAKSVYNFLTTRTKKRKVMYVPQEGRHFSLNGAEQLSFGF